MAMLNEQHDQVSVMMPVVFSAQDIADLITTALEGGSNYWVLHAQYADLGLYKELRRDQDDYPVYADGAYWARGGEMKIVTHEDGPAEMLLNIVRMQIAIETVCKSDFGLQERMKDFEACQWDAEDADLILQIAVLGEVTYG